MVRPAIMRGDMVDGRVENNVVVEIGSPDHDVEKLASGRGILKTMDIHQEEYPRDNNSQEALRGGSC
jgi:hypothetical protein